MSEYLKTEEGKAYFITCTVINWIDIFTRECYVNILVDSIKHCQKNKGLEVYAYCIMPSHFHMIARVKDGTLGILLKNLKGFTARKILEEIKENPKESRKEWLLEAFKNAGTNSPQKQTYQFWQHDNYPVELYSDKFIIQKEMYIHMNPVEQGLVSRSEHYRLSSASDESPIKILGWK
jgi:putative transposase